MGKQERAELRADLKKLEAIPDEVFRKALRNAFVKKMAEKFAVPFAAMEIRIAGSGPYLPPE